MTEASAPSATTTAATPRPAVLDLPPRAAAAHAVPDALCPVCGATTLAAHKIPGLTPGAKKAAVRCAQCNFVAPAVPSVGSLVVRALVSAAILAVVLLLASKGIAGKASLKGVLVAFAGIAGPLYGLLVRRWTVRETERLIASGRGRWSREKEEHDFKIEPRALLDACKVDQPCPVCGKAQLTGPSPNPIWSRGNLRCSRCRLDVPMALTEGGLIASLAVALALVVGGALLARDGFVNHTGNEFLYRVLIGFLIGAGGIYLGFLAQASGDDLALKELERAKRRHERRKRGLPVKDDDEEPAVWFQENLEAVVVAVILALIIRHFVMEAFVIPTGSMAPTLLGDHFSATCSNCRYKFPVAKREGDMGSSGERVEVRCPLCGLQDEQNTFQFRYQDVQGGNKILVNKFLYKFQPPQRWDVVVFKYPQDPLRKNFIKRLVGLPGETLTIDARGDVSVRAPGSDKPVLARKPRHVQEELWMPSYDSRFPDPRMQLWKPETAEQTKRWVFERLPTGGETFTATPGQGEACLHYTKEIKDNYGYNHAGQSAAGHNTVGDVRVRAVVVPDKDCKAIRLSTEENSRVLTAEIPVGTGDVAVLASNTMDHEIQKAPCKPLKPGVANDVALGYADERLTLVVNGEVVFEWDDPTWFAQTMTSSVRVAAVGPGGARFEQVKVDRDLVYVPSGSYDPSSRPGGVLVPDDGYFVMGDNSPNSQDGRVFGFVRESHLIGRAFLVFWPLLEVKLIR